MAGFLLRGKVILWHRNARGVALNTLTPPHKVARAAGILRDYYYATRCRVADIYLPRRAGAASG